jgi:hypothetical protein
VPRLSPQMGFYKANGWNADEKLTEYYAGMADSVNM